MLLQQQHDSSMPNCQLTPKASQKHPWGAANRSLVLFSLVACYLYVNNTLSENKYDFHHTAGHSKIDLLVAFHHTAGKLHTLSVTIITIFSL